MITTHRSIPCTAARQAPHQPMRHDPLTKPALLLFGTAALSLALMGSGSFKPEEAGVIATASAGGAIACLMMDRSQRQH